MSCVWWKSQKLISKLRNHRNYFFILKEIKSWHKLQHQSCKYSIVGEFIYKLLLLRHRRSRVNLEVAYIGRVKKRCSPFVSAISADTSDSSLNPVSQNSNSFQFVQLRRPPLRKRKFSKFPQTPHTDSAPSTFSPAGL